jgi:hypothetical protein
MTNLSTTKIGAMFAVLSLAILFTMGTSVRNASATTNTVCTDTNTSMNVLDEAPVPLNAPISCVGSTSNAGVTTHEVIIQANNVVQSDTSGSGSSASFSFTANQPGNWNVTIVYRGPLGEIEDHFITAFSVSFMVLPESPIGIAAITGSSLAALGAFVGLRRLRSA